MTRLDAVNLVREFLGVAPRLLPMSEEPATLEAADADGALVSGETAVDRMPAVPARLWLSPEVAATPEVVSAVQTADLILMGPGSVITSVLPSLLVPCARPAGGCVGRGRGGWST